MSLATSDVLYDASFLECDEKSSNTPFLECDEKSSNTPFESD
jgi:hypothetical protein